MMFGILVLLSLEKGFGKTHIDVLLGGFLILAVADKI